MLTHWGSPPPNGLNERPKRRRSFDKDQRFRFLAELRQPIESGVRRRLNSGLAARLHGKQRSAIMYQALKAVRGHIQSCDIEGVFVSCRRLDALRLKDPVDLTLDLRQICLRLRCSYAASE